MPAMAFPEPPGAAANRIPRKDTIRVRSLHIPACKSQMDRLARYLSASELDRAGRFLFQADHDRYVAARACLRLQLGTFLDRDPKSLSFQYTSFGKPFIEKCGVEFNLSHSGDWALFAFTHSAEVGVDIEHIRPIPGMRDVAELNFAASEFARWQSTPEQDRVQAFYRCWTRKESFIKAIGEGLSCPLDSFEVSFGLHQPAGLTGMDGKEALASPWWMADLPEFPGYAAAVTARHATQRAMTLAVSQIAASDLWQ